MANVGTGADTLGMTLHDLQDGITVPVMGWFGMIVNRQIDLILGTEPVEQVKRIFGRLGDDRLEPEFLAKVEYLPIRGLVLRESNHAVGDHSDIIVGELLLELRDQFIGHLVIDVSRTIFGETLTRIDLDVVNAQGLEHVERFQERERAKRVGLAAELPTKFVQGSLIDGRFGRVAGKGLQRENSSNNDKPESEMPHGASAVAFPTPDYASGQGALNR